jgi:tetratricopeptide (TPR) repeat protein
MKKPPPGLRVFLVCLGLFFCTLLLFSRAVPHDFLDLDDGDYVTNNPQVQEGLAWPDVRWALTANVGANWHPLTLLSHMLDCRLFGGNAHGHHATNVFWHALNAVMAFLALRRLTGSFWTSALSAALFAWHPLRVESVAWIAERKDVLSGFFGLFTLWAYAAYSEKRRVNRGGTAVWYALTLAAFAAGLLCKPMLVTLPFLLLLLDWWPLQRLASDEWRATGVLRLLMEKIPFFLLSAASCFVTYFYQRAAGAVGNTFAFKVRLANAMVSVTRYLGKFFWPFNLTVGYPLPNHWPVAIVIGASLLVLAITCVALWQWCRRPWLFVGWFWFLGMLVPVLGLVQAGLQAMADRYTYLPILGVQLMLFWTLRASFLTATARLFTPVAITMLLACCAARTWDQLGVWRNSYTLQNHALAVTQDNYLAYFYFGTTLLNEDRYAEAVVHLRHALELKPDFTADHYRLGVALQKMGRTNEAMAVFKTVLKDNPGYGVADYSLGALLLEQKQPAEAVSYFQAALNTKPDYAPAYVALGTAWSALDRPRDAITNFAKALVLNPRNAPAHYDWANALVDLHQTREALTHYEKALQLDPDFEVAHCNYGNALRALNLLDAACAQYRQALKLQPDDAAVYYGLGAALEDSGKMDEALASYNEAIRLKPDYAEAQYDIGAILLNQSKPTEAITHLLAAVKSRPDYDIAYLGLGLAAAQLGRQPEAIAYYERVLAITPDSADALCCIGVALRREGRLADAIPYYERALRLKPDYAEAHAELGNALYRTGRQSEAIPHLEQALKLHPGFPGISEILARAQSGQEVGGK